MGRGKLMLFKFATAVVLALSAIICVSGAIAQDMQPGRGGGSFVETDPIATPLANAALDGVADGSGVSNVAAFRLALSLGTAATANTGTTSGTIPILGVSGLPSVGASLLTGITSSQVSGLGTAAAAAATDFQSASVNLTALGGVTSGTNQLPYFTGIGTASTTSITAAAMSLLDDGSAADMRTTLNVDASGTSPYAADSWDYAWTYADGNLTSNGWSSTGTYTATVAATTKGTPAVSCYCVTPSSSGVSYITYAGTAATGNWELRARAYITTASSSGSNRYGLVYVPANATFGTSRLETYVMVSALGYGASGTGAPTSLATTPSFAGKWVDLTVRMYMAGTGVANGWLEYWIGTERMVGVTLPSSVTAVFTEGTALVGKLSSSTGVDPICFTDIKIKWSGVNAAPPSYTFRNETWPL